MALDNLLKKLSVRSPWLFRINAGSCNGCDIELVSVLTPRYDAERLGFKLTGTPRHADIVVVTGPVTKQSLPRVLSAISQVPEPRCIVTMGSCPQSGNVFKGSYSVAGPLSKYVHVDVDVAGCAPKPEAIIDGVVTALDVLKAKMGLGSAPEPMLMPGDADDGTPAGAVGDNSGQEPDTAAHMNNAG